MKNNKLLLTIGLLTLLTGCGIFNSNSTTPIIPTSNNPTIQQTTTPTTVKPTETPTTEKPTTAKPTTQTPTTVKPTETPTTVTPTTVTPTTVTPTTVTPTTVTPTTVTPTTTPEPSRKDDYAYEPHLTEKMPKISVKTTDGSNEFATKYNRQDKLNGLVDYVDCTITTSNCEDDYLLEDVACEIKVRGNYTLEYEKKPLRLKFNKKQKMFGLNDDAKAKSWVLLADWKDRSMMNNATTFFLGNTILESDGYYSSDFRYVEVELNGEYWGVYLLVEQQQLNEYRVDLPEPEDDYEGTDIGYLIEYDGYYNLEDPRKGGDYTFTMNYNNNAPLKYYGGNTYTDLGNKGYTIKSDITSTKQVTFIQNFMNNAYKVIYEAAYNDKAYVFNEDFTSISLTNDITPREAIERVVDTKSLANTYLIQEIACDADISWSSFYMDVSFEKDNFKRITFEAPWDFDSAYGIKNGVVNNAQGLFAAKKNNVWLTILINEDWFQELIKDKWAELVEYKVLDRSLEHNRLATELYKNEFEKEMTRWPGKKYNNELTGTVNSFTTQAQAAEYAYNWTKSRYEFINTVWGDGEELFKDPNDVIPENSTAYRYELENAVINGGPVAKDDATASGGKYVSQVSGKAGATLEHKVTCEAGGTAYLKIGLSALSDNTSLNSMFDFIINGQRLTYNNRTIPGVGSAHNWHNWTECSVGVIELQDGVNTITVKVLGSATNLDYIDVYYSSKLV